MCNSDDGCLLLHTRNTSTKASSAADNNNTYKPVLGQTGAGGVIGAAPSPSQRLRAQSVGLILVCGVLRRASFCLFVFAFSINSIILLASRKFIIKFELPSLNNCTKI